MTQIIADSEKSMPNEKASFIRLLKNPHLFVIYGLNFIGAGAIAYLLLD